MSANSDECVHCRRAGYGKGKDDYGHIHCRMCMDKSGYGRTIAAVGGEWLVWCETARRVVTVQEVILKNRERPKEFTVPVDMFRDECQMIQIMVGKGPETKTFAIHEPLLTTSSAYFQRALQSTFKEGKESKVQLEEEDPLIFGLMNEYLYSGHVRVSCGIVTEKRLRWLCFCELWLLGHYLQMPKLINYAMYQIFEWMDAIDKASAPSYPDIEEIYDVYERAPVDSKLRKFLADLLVWSGWNLKLTQDAPNQLLLDMVAELRRKCVSSARPPLLDARIYYMKEEELVPVKEKIAEKDAAKTD